MRRFGPRMALLITLILMTSTFVWGQYGGGGSGGSQQPGPNGVNIQNFEFVPETLTVAADTKVTWKNLDSAAHTATSRSGLFDTGNLGRNQEGTFTFTSAGTFEYFCKIHPSMTGRVVVTSGGPAAQTPAKFGATVTRDQEVPAPAALVAGQSPASGMGYFQLNASANELFYNLTYATMTGNVAAIHFHKAKKGEAGGVVRLICGGSSPCPSGTGAFVFGTWKSTDAQPLTAELIQALKDGEIYVNVHTAANPGGEIRGQLAPVSFVAALTREQEVPAPKPLEGSAGPAYGTAIFVLNSDSTELKFDLTYTTMTGNVSAAHLHRAKEGTAGPVVKLICGSPGSACPTGTGATVSGVWKSTDAQPLTPDLVKALKDGEIYVNVHTAANPGGEIRGQLK